MKIRTEADVRALDEKIKTELGVDISKYRDEETVETLSSLITFPLYALNWTVRPVIIAFLLYLLGYWIIDLVHVQYLIYGIFGLVLFLICGLFAGLFYLTIRFQSDIKLLTNYSLTVLRGIVADLDRLNTTTNQTNRAEVLKLLFLGITHLITIPVTSSIIGNKVPFVGGLVSGLVSRVLTRLSNVFRFDKLELSEASQQAGGEGKILPYYLASVSGFHNIVDKSLGVAMKIVQWPLGIFLGGFALTTALFIWLIN
ncbi:MAG: hypothetical protein AAF597_02195 [Bacteroidota bacterium]